MSVILIFALQITKCEPEVLHLERCNMSDS